MKRLFFLCLPLAAAFAAFAEPVTSEAEKDGLLRGVRSVRAPFVKDGCVVWTEEASPKFVGIAFEREDFAEIHPFERLNFYGDEGEVENSLLFFIYRVPRGERALDYRLVIDGLWTTDPQNELESYDGERGILMSRVDVEPPDENMTEQLPDGRVRFVYPHPASPGRRVSLAGSFNNWDPCMHFLEERGGVQSITLSVPPGTHRYVFMVGMKREVDPTTSERGWTGDGKYVSVIDVK